MLVASEASSMGLDQEKEAQSSVVAKYLLMTFKASLKGLSSGNDGMIIKHSDQWLHESKKGNSYRSFARAVAPTICKKDHNRTVMVLPYGASTHVPAIHGTFPWWAIEISY